MYYPDAIIKSVQALCDELEKYIPGITNCKYSKGDDEWSFINRMQMVLYFELLFAKKIECLEEKS